MVHWRVVRNSRVTGRSIFVPQVLIGSKMVLDLPFSRKRCCTSSSRLLIDVHVSNALSHSTNLVL
jgi:hypothetical protein